jgi:hypothetical protein
MTEKQVFTKDHFCQFANKRTSFDDYFRQANTSQYFLDNPRMSFESRFDYSYIGNNNKSIRKLCIITKLNRLS